MAAEMCLLQLPALLAGEAAPEASPTTAEFRPSPFFAEQLTAFELWLAHGSAAKQPPEQLPIVLQVRAAAPVHAHLLTSSFDMRF
jgi:regulator-associated protein of mTOR